MKNDTYLSFLLLSITAHIQVLKYLREYLVLLKGWLDNMM